MKKAIFLNTQLISAPEPLKLLKDAEFCLVGIVDQARNFDPAFDAYYYCPHFQQDCECKIPKPGLLFEAAKALNLDLKNSWLIGQTLDEIEAAHRAGCMTILLTNGAETQWHVTPMRQPQFLSPNLEYAAGAVVLKSIYQMIRQQEVN